MKKFSLSLICMIFAAVLICGSVFAKPKTGKKEEAPDPNIVYNFETPEGEIVTPGVFDFDTVFPLMPDGFRTYPTSYKGTIERLYYETDVYEDGVTYQKYCTVYLPYGYDPEDKDTKYNVFYYQHGNSNTPNDFWDRDSAEYNPKRMMDNLMDPEHGVFEPFIIICPTYYFEAKKNTKFISDAAGPAGDGRYEGIPGNYYKELIEDLIPQIESRYNVYCDDFSPEGIKASRDHRAFGGFSRGSMCTWNIMHYDFEYFKYFMPMSAGITPVGKPLADSERFTPEEAFDYIREPIAQNPDLDFFLFATSGGEGDGAGRSMVPQMQEFIKHDDVFSYGTDTGENNFYFTLSAFDHMDMITPYSFYNAKDILFK